MPVEEKMGEPAWARMQFCGVCPRHIQPNEGFSLIDFVVHQHHHVEDALREAMLDARQFHASLKAIDNFLSQNVVRPNPDPNVEVFRTMIQSYVDQSLRR